MTPLMMAPALMLLEALLAEQAPLLREVLVLGQNMNKAQLTKKLATRNSSDLPSSQLTHN